MGKGKVFYDRRGFTLMEMLVAVALFGVIIWILIPEFMNAQKKSRDARRKADLGKISEALEEYRSDYGFYPTPYPTFAVGPMVGANSEYLKNVPLDPKYKTAYCYIPSANNLSYILSALFELEQSECPWAPTATPTPTPGPTLPPGAPTATPTPGGPTATPTPGPSGCTPCTALGISYCCGDQVFQNSQCAMPNVGTFLCSPGPNTNTWQKIGADGNCAWDLTSVGKPVGDICPLGTAYGTIDSACHFEDSTCGTPPLGYPFLVMRRYTTCICW